MWWLLLFFGSLFGLLILMTLIGLLLPRRHRAARYRVFTASPERVYAAVYDMEAAPSWRKDVRRAERLPDRNGNEVWREMTARGPLITELTELIRGEKIVRKVVDNPSFGGTWTYTITPEGHGARLTITEDGEIRNPLFRFMGNVFFSMTSTMEKYFDALAVHLGEHVLPENQ